VTSIALGQFTLQLAVAILASGTPTCQTAAYE
jgi:hypothetical protein